MVEESAEPEAEPQAEPQPESGGCVQCGRTPTADVDLRANTGLVLKRRVSRITGPFCRACGMARFREQMDHTLRLGWWGVTSFFSNFAAVYANLRSWSALRRLDPPTGEPAPPASPLDPGRPLYLRPGIYVLLVALMAIGLAGAALVPTPVDDFEGRCVRIDTFARRVRTAGCNQPNDGQVVEVIDAGELCPAGTESLLRLRDDEDRALCLDTGG
jgi:hypothetical protein